MDFETNLDVLKVHGQVLSRLAHNVNGCLQNSMLLKNNHSQSVVIDENKSVDMSWKNLPYR